MTVFFDKVVSALTPLQRLDAISKHHSNSVANQWFFTIGLGIAAILLLLLLYSRYRRRKNSQMPSVKLFDRYAEEKSLTENEYNILLNIAVNADLKRYESIFTLPSTFDRESAKMLENAQEQTPPEQFHQLKAILTVLRTKIGFPQLAPANVISNADMNTSCTQQIPVKKKIYVKLNRQESHDDLEATVTANGPAGLTIQFSTSIEIVFGQLWTCRYYSGTFVAEFDTTVIKCNGLTVVLSHSHQVRLVNRRKFLRVPVSKPAFIAHFPFRKEPLAEKNRPRKKITSIENPSHATGTLFEPPRFVPATVTELGGPGLRINTWLNLRTGDRVLLMFKLDQKETDSETNAHTLSEKIIEHIAIVRHISDNTGQPSVALELTGLNDDDINELIRATNETLIRTNKWKRNFGRSDVHRDRAQECVAI